MVQPKVLNPADVRRAAMDLLARREHGSEELAGKLRRKFRRHDAAHDIIRAELDRLTEEGLLSDERFAAAMVRQLINRGLGPRRLDQELRAKGMYTTWSECIDTSDALLDWFDRAEQVYEKKFAGTPWPDERAAQQKERARRARFMFYRGFDADHFMHLLESDP